MYTYEKFVCSAELPTFQAASVNSCCCVVTPAFIWALKISVIHRDKNKVAYDWTKSMTTSSEQIKIVILSRTAAFANKLWTMDFTYFDEFGRKRPSVSILSEDGKPEIQEMRRKRSWRGGWKCTFLLKLFHHFQLTDPWRKSLLRNEKRQFCVKIVLVGIKKLTLKALKIYRWGRRVRSFSTKQNIKISITILWHLAFTTYGGRSSINFNILTV